MNNWKDYTLNGLKFVFLLNTKRHVWEVYAGDIISNKQPIEIFTKAKGEAVIKFLEHLKESKEGS